LCVPFATAEERATTPGRARLASAEEPASTEAAERWRQLKAKSARADASEFAAHPRRIPVRKGPVREIPDGDEGGSANEGGRSNPSAFPFPNVDLPGPPLPFSEEDDAPEWIHGIAAEAALLQPKAVPAPSSNAAPGQPTPMQPESNAADEPPTLRPLIPRRPGMPDPGYARPETSGRPRNIRDILPTYNRTFDEDIRKFARQQAQLYDVPGAPAGPFPQRAFPATAYCWEPSNLYHYPLYFQDPQLERYGHTYGDHVQPFVSIARFGVQFVGLPYQMTIAPPNCPIYALGWYRPGECAPKLHYQIPLNLKAALVEAAVVTGIAFAIP
jgi:hypothetical protein